MVIVTKNKGEVCRALELDAFIDDKPSNCEDVVNEVIRPIKVFLHDASHNQGFIGRDIRRVKDLSEFFQRIRRG